MNSSDFAQYLEAFRELLADASKLLGDTARPLTLEWEIARMLERHVRRESRHGIGGLEPVLWIDDGVPGHSVAVGMERMRLELAQGTIWLVRVTVPCSASVPCFWAVRKSDLARVYRFLRRLMRQECQQESPIMEQAVQDRLWQNTIGFLRRDHSRLQQFGVPQKRGVLLLGKPGNGKTMACRWLRSQCQRHHLDWQSVTVDEFEAARRDGELHELFDLDRPGIVLFDDFDGVLRERVESGRDAEQQTFRTELDGLDPKSGTVYLFTSNVKLTEIDAALRRPGRIDHIVHLEAPTAALRKALIGRRWHPEMVTHLNLERVVADTEGLSFAEIEEAKKLLVLHFLDTGRWDWSYVTRLVGERCRLVEPNRRIGFTAVVAESVVGEGGGNRRISNKEW